MSSKKVSLADQAYQIIKERILNLTYPPGMQLTEALLTEELNMSRNPIRTAVRILQTEGLIVSDYYKSITVKEITKQDIREIYQLRELLEQEAFRLIFTSERAEEFSYRIEEKVVRMCAAAHNIFEWEMADTKMHLEIIRIFENERIDRIYENNLSELIRMGLCSIKNGMSIHTTNENLKNMVSLMRENNYEDSYAILRMEHLTIGKNSALNE